jgi:hypothetical protein
MLEICDNQEAVQHSAENIGAKHGFIKGLVGS